MNSIAVPGLKIGQQFGGGLFVAAYAHGEERRALVLAPKLEGQFKDECWNGKYDKVAGAASWFDGLANTRAMAEAGSELAQKMLALRIGGFDDWHLPAVDQLEICYRALKPGTLPNECWARSGINLSAIPATWPYTPDAPTMTEIEIFREDAAEAFDTRGWYWTSTQHPGYSDCAYVQDFADGYQYGDRKGYRYFGRAVRSVSI